MPRCDQRQAALRGHHACDGPTGAEDLTHVGEAQGLFFQGAQAWHEPWEEGAIQVCALNAFQVKDDKVLFAR